MNDSPFRPRNRAALTAALAFILAAAACAGDAGEEAEENSGAAVCSDYVEGASVTLVGRLKAKGSEPLAWAALETDDGLFKLVGPKAEKLFREHQLERVRIRGIVVGAGSPPFLPPEIEVIRYRSAE